MREVKFRCWNGHKMFIPKHLTKTPSGFVYSPASGGVFEGDRNKQILMQFTGLHDKNGKEIYEGDVVRDCDTSDLEFEVKWDSGKAGYYMPPEFDYEYVWSINSVTLEVIGNIYENPELINH